MIQIQQMIQESITNDRMEGGYAPSHRNLLLRWEDKESSLLLGVTMCQALFLEFFIFSISFAVHANSVDRL